MESLYDVFSAIRDDEGDHVSTMEACLDPKVAKLSPSLERKVLTGIAAAAAAAIFFNAGSGIGVGTDLVDNVDLDTLDAMADIAIDEGTSYGVLDAIIAGAAGFLNQLETNDEEGNLVGSVLSRGRQMPELRTLVAEIAAILARLF